VIVASQCAFCQHVTRANGVTSCAAFPDGVPAAILNNERDHRGPFPGDQGLRYELRDELVAEFYPGWHPMAERVEAEA